MTITVNQAINSLPYYTQKRANKMPNKLTFCNMFPSIFLFSGFWSLCYFFFGKLVSVGGVLRSFQGVRCGPSSWEVGEPQSGIAELILYSDKKHEESYLLEQEMESDLNCSCFG